MRGRGKGRHVLVARPKMDAKSVDAGSWLPSESLGPRSGERISGAERAKSRAREAATGLGSSCGPLEKAKDKGEAVKQGVADRFKTLWPYLEVSVRARSRLYDRHVMSQPILGPLPPPLDVATLKAAAKSFTKGKAMNLSGPHT